MADKKFILAATIVALTIFGAPLAASAAPAHTTNPQGGISFHTEDSEDNNEGDGEGDGDDRHGSIPPVFVVPGQKKPHTQHKPNVGSTPATGTSTTTTGGTAGIDPLSGDQIPQVGADGQPIQGAPGSDNLDGVKPEDARAVDITRVPERMMSPADQFMDAAYLGLGLLGLSAVGLGVTAGVRAVRLRRNGNTDYVYGNK